MQYKIPQNIDMEDKIVGPFTMKQFIYLLVSGFIVYSWWNFSNTFISPPPIIVFIPLGVPVGILGLCFALLKINDRPFEFFVLSIIRFIFAPKKTMWREGYKPPEVIVKDTIVEEKEKTVRDTKTLDELSKVLDTSQNELEKKMPTTAQTKKAPLAMDISVKDVKSSQDKQVQAQTNGPNNMNKAPAQNNQNVGKSGGFWSKLTGKK